MSLKNEIRWTILVTDNYVQSRTFYAATLGFTIAREVAAEEFCQFTLAQGMFLAIYGRSFFEKLLPAGTLKQSGGAVYSFPDSTDIDADCAALAAKGVNFVTKPTTQVWGQRTAYFTDPDGHIWELQQWVS